ncbi:MAG TPA: CSLREA domain-containing protein, partial [Candidatus Saccharibacteria bacterium]|nr:CSLREA domain-containing protein [Candidatus Saccharibacteria bacterium]
IVLPKHAQAATTFTVTSTTDDVDSPDNNPGDGVCASNNVGNPCTLRAAIEEANALAGADTIEFNITPLDGSVKTIAPSSQLPDITGQVTIDGYTQDPTVSEPNTAVSPAPLNGTLLIELSGENAGSPGINGLTIKADSTIVQGLSINRFSNDAVVVAADNVKIWGNYIGTDPTGLIDRGNGGSGVAQANGDNDNLEFGGLTPNKRNISSGNNNTGLSPNDGSDNWLIQGNYFGLAANGTSAIPNSSPGGAGALSIDNSSGTTIGGVSTGAPNVISGNLGAGIAPDYTVDLVVQGNYIGTDHTGMVALPNGGPGISDTNGTNTIIGGSSLAARNIISGNADYGVSLMNSTNFKVAGNYIGVAGDSSALANGNTGVNIDGSLGVVGGSTAGEGNIIANSTSSFGLNVVEVTNTAQVSILGNSIYDNNDIGIAFDSAIRPNDYLDTDTGPNNYLNTPVFRSVSESSGNTTVLYRLDAPAGDYRIEFFSNSVADPSGSGEGETYLGFQNITHSGGGLQQFTYTLTGVTGVTNLALTATERNMSTPSTFGATSQFGGVAPQLTDVSLEKTILNPGSVSAGGAVDYQLTVTNNGLDDLDLTQFDNPLGTAIITDFLDPDLTPANLNLDAPGPIPDSFYLSDVGNPDLTCLWGGPGSGAIVGLTTYGGYGFVTCTFTGVGDTTLEAGASLSMVLNANIAGGSDMMFANYALATPSLLADPDNAAIASIFGVGEDYLALFIANQSSNSPINNFASAVYPVPVTPTQTTQSTGSNNGALGTTGQIIYSWQMLGVFLVSTGLLVRQWRRKRCVAYSLRA